MTSLLIIPSVLAKVFYFFIIIQGLSRKQNPLFFSCLWAVSWFRRELITIYLTSRICLLNRHLQDDVSKSENAENSTKKLAGDSIGHGIRNPFIKHICHRSQRRESIFHPGKLILSIKSETIKVRCEAN